MMETLNNGGVLQFLTAQLAAFEALLLMASAAHKLSGWRELVGTLQRFAGLPSWLAPPALGAALLTELVAGVSLGASAPLLRAGGAVLACLVWAVYLLLILRAVLQGRREVDCGCSFGAGRQPLGAYHLARNALLLAGAVAVASVTVFSGSASLPASQWLPAAALLALYGALDQVMGLERLRGGATA